LYKRAEISANTAIPALAVSVTYSKQEKAANPGSTPVSATILPFKINVVLYLLFRLSFSCKSAKPDDAEERRGCSGEREQNIENTVLANRPMSDRFPPAK